MAEPIKSFARDFVRSLSNPAGVTAASLSDLWADAAGGDVATKSRVIGIRRGTLLVSTASSALKSEIEAYRRPGILARLAERAAPLRISRLQIVLDNA